MKEFLKQSTQNKFSEKSLQENIMEFLKESTEQIPKESPEEYFLMNP